MAKARYFVEVKKFTSLHGSELLSDTDFTSRKLAERTFFNEATHHIRDPNMLVLLCQRADYVQRVLAAKYRPDKHVTLEPAFFGL
jgi:hypothetical protein